MTHVHAYIGLGQSWADTRKQTAFNIVMISIRFCSLILGFAYVHVDVMLLSLTLLHLHRYTGLTKLNGANAVSFVVVKHVLEKFDNFGR